MAGRPAAGPDDGVYGGRRRRRAAGAVRTRAAERVCSLQECRSGGRAGRLAAPGLRRQGPARRARVARAAARGCAAGLRRWPCVHAPQREFPRAGLRTARRAVAPARDRRTDRPGRGRTGAARRAARRTRPPRKPAFEQRKAALNELRFAAEMLQQSLHESELAILKLSEQAQRVTQRGEQIAAELAEIDAQSGHERAQHDAAQNPCRRSSTSCASNWRAGTRARSGEYAAAQAALEQQRQMVQQAERAAQESAFHLKTCAQQDRRSRKRDQAGRR